MNKKRVALALAAALGINTLMVTVGQVGQQTVIAHATQASGRLSDDKLAQFGVTSFETLNTTVQVVSDGKVEVAFDNVDLSNVRSVNDVNFTHEIFTERTDIDGQAINGVKGTWANNKLTVDGMTKPGIYTGTVTINLNDGTKKIFKLSLVRKASDTVSFTTEVNTSALKINGLKINNATVASITGTISLNGGTPQDVKFDANGNAVVSLLGYKNLKAGDKFALTVKYGKRNEYSVTSDIVLVEQSDPEITTKFPTNNAAGANKAETKLQSEIVADGLAGYTVAVTRNGNISTLKATTTNGSEVDVISYDQSMGGNASNILGGGVLSITEATNPKVAFDVSVTSTTSKKDAADIPAETDNYVPVVGVSYEATVAKNGLIGSYYFAINGEKSNYFEGSVNANGEKLEPFTSGTGATTKVIYSKNAGASGEDIVSDMTKTLTSQGKTNRISVNLANKLTHGYSAIPVEFTVDFESDEKKFNTANGKVVDEPLAAANVGSVKKQNANKIVKTSIIVGADTLNAISANARFEKTGASTGRIIITGDGLTVDPSATLTVTGARATQLNTTASKAGELVFEVAFDKDITDTSTKWSLGFKGETLNGTVDLTSGSIESVNVTISAKNNTNTTDTFIMEASFVDSIVNSGNKSFVSGSNSSILLDSIKLTDLSTSNGNAVYSKVIQGKYQGTYSAGVWAVEQPMKSVISTAKDSKSSTQVDLTIDATFKNEKDYENVQKAVIEYRKVGDTNWTKGLDLTTGANSDLSNDAPNGKTITKTVTANYETEKEYEFRVVYTYKDVKNPIVSNVVKTKISKTLASGNNNGTITGNGSSSSTTGTSTGSTTISVNTNNSTLSGTSASVKLPSGFRYDSSKTPVATTFKYKDKDGKVVTETKEQFSNVTVKFNGDNVEVNGLVPGKNYDEITVDYTDNNGRTRSIILRNIQTSTTVESDKYLANVYTVVFDRPADEAGYHFHLDNLKNKRVSLREFLLNMLSEKEFIEKYKSTEQKVEALYSAIVARSSDEAGKKFWVEEYNKALKVYGSESTALRAIADRMVNENELKELADKMGVQW